ncbi:polysaccharide pyruvyl transferase family protein [Helicobacter trogontum]|uniref:Polysaccharide pyruvyl transferase domain-containing protein n=1 Tax=Helicobacter trogontum TaxID=50960 RepID=A0A4U8TEX5_9HELI|nr:polysaccharide pyruvyl transferase family protein [Helicobacter trogontum]MCI5787110.1 polysaccharide pyruvyl transferase family protein [Helicobacter trogontum]MDY5184684.1 polysaccharide pyruvyl transferase family protein [Helicobacter trogontum]TLD97928.1 hypothetical protein LS80_006790 [Helicobacter trogontum]
MTEGYYSDVRQLAWWIPGKKTRHAMRNVLYHLGNIDSMAGEVQRRANAVLADITLYRDKPRVFLLQTPEYGNTGDQAIALATRVFLESYFPNTAIIEYSLNDIFLCGDLIARFITSQDIIFLQGGGNMGNLWMDIESARRRLVSQFPDNRIIICPVSVSFTCDEDGEKEILNSKEYYNAHRNLSIMARDSKSYELAKKYFTNNDIVLIPDIACYLTKHTSFLTQTQKCKDVMLIFRNDKEKVLSNEMINKIKIYCDNSNLTYNEIDTCIAQNDITQHTRHFIVRQMLNNFTSHSLCITDRFHGMLFSYITKTPCIVFPSLDHKISYGYEWLQDLSWIYKVQPNDDIYTIQSVITKFLHTQSCQDSIDLANVFSQIFNQFYKKGEILCI